MRSPHPAVTRAAACKCRSMLRSTRRATFGYPTTDSTRTLAIGRRRNETPPAAAVRASCCSAGWPSPSARHRSGRPSHSNRPAQLSDALRVLAYQSNRPGLSHANPRRKCCSPTKSTRPLSTCAVTRRRISSGCKAHPATAPAGSNRGRHGGDEMSEAFG